MVYTIDPVKFYDGPPPESVERLRFRRPSVDPVRETEIRKEIRDLNQRIRDLQEELQSLEKESPASVLKIFETFSPNKGAYRPVEAHMTRFIDAINFLVEQGDLIAEEVRGKIGWRLPTVAEKEERRVAAEVGSTPLGLRCITPSPLKTEEMRS